MNTFLGMAASSTTGVGSVVGAGWAASRRPTLSRAILVRTKVTPNAMVIVAMSPMLVALRVHQPKGFFRSILPSFAQPAHLPTFATSDFSSGATGPG